MILGYRGRHMIVLIGALLAEVAGTQIKWGRLRVLSVFVDGF